MVIGDVYEPAARRGPAGRCDVAAKGDEHSTARRFRGGLGRAVGGQSLRGGAEVEPPESLGFIRRPTV